MAPVQAPVPGNSPPCFVLEVPHLEYTGAMPMADPHGGNRWGRTTGAVVNSHVLCRLSYVSIYDPGPEGHRSTVWSNMRDSNPHRQFGRLGCCRLHQCCIGWAAGEEVKNPAARERKERRR